MNKDLIPQVLEADEYKEIPPLLRFLANGSRRHFGTEVPGFEDVVLIDVLCQDGKFFSRESYYTSEVKGKVEDIVTLMEVRPSAMRTVSLTSSWCIDSYEVGNIVAIEHRPSPLVDGEKYWMIMAIYSL